MNNYVELHNLLKSQFPDFAVPEYANIIKFMEYYFQFNEQNEFRQYKNMHDIDNNIDTFIEHIKYQLGLNIPKINDADERFLLKHIKEFYSTKGTEESFKILFRHLFDKEIQIQYPKEYIFKASDGKWQQDISIVIIANPGTEPSLLEGQFVSVLHTIKNTNDTKNVELYVKRVNHVFENIYEIFVGDFYHDDIAIGDIITDYTNNHQYVVQPCLSSNVKILKTGSKFKIGQIFDIKSSTGTGAKCKVISVGNDGELKKVQIISFGHGYTTGFNTYLVSQFSKITNENTSYIYDYSGGFIENIEITKNDYFIDYGQPDFAKTVLTSVFIDNSSTPGYQINDSYTAIIKCSLTDFQKYPGQYTASDGFVSDAMVLQDSYYYQIYSYAIRVSETIDKYKDIIKKILNPAGYKFFTEYVLDSEIELGSYTETAINIIRTLVNDELSECIDVLNILISKSLSDSISVSDSINTKNTNKRLNDTNYASDVITTKSISKKLNESISLTDSNKRSTSKKLNETLSLTDSNKRSTSKKLNESISLTDSNQRLTSKKLNESISISESASMLIYSALYTYFASDYSSDIYSLTAQTINLF